MDRLNLDLIAAGAERCPLRFPSTSYVSPGAVLGSQSGVSPQSGAFSLPTGADFSALDVKGLVLRRRCGGVPSASRCGDARHRTM
jgi:hypothetical protein